jgi:hypothetical protein
MYIRGQVGRQQLSPRPAAGTVGRRTIVTIVLASILELPFLGRCLRQAHALAEGHQGVQGS